MTQDDVIRLATEAGLCATSNGFVDWIDAGPSLHEMTEFAKLVAKHSANVEREACAKVCDEFSNPRKFVSVTAMQCADAIRARGETTSRGQE